MTHETSARASFLAMPRSLSWTMALLLLLGSSIDQVDALGSFQSGPLNGAVHTGAMDYSQHHIFITGITYGTNGNIHSDEAMCFVSKISSNHIGSDEEIFSTVLGDGDRMQSCHAISVIHEPSKPKIGSKAPFVVGGTSGIGLSENPSGFLVTFGQDDHDGEFPRNFEVFTDEAGQTDRVSYPVSMRYVFGHDENGDGDKHNDKHDRITYIASLTSLDMSENPGNAQLTAGKGKPNWMKYYKFGTSFELGLQKFTKANGSSEETESWTKIYPVDANSQTGVKPDIYVGGMIVIRRKNKDFLVVAGTTSGTGEVYGNAVPGSTDEDGFIAVFSGHTGELRNLPTNQPDFKSTARPGTPKTDLVLGICDCPLDSDHFYIVGATGDPEGMGDPIRTDSAVFASHPGSLHGFVQKIEVNTLKKVWGKTWSANYRLTGESGRAAVTAGYGCKVIQDGSVYVAGLVEDGAHIQRDAETNHELDDVVAMKLTADGDVEWMTQFGSKDGNEALARSGAVAVDKDENLIIAGDTTGSMFRNRKRTDHKSDMFVVTLQKSTGEHDEMVPANHEGQWFHESTYEGHKEDKQNNKNRGDHNGEHQKGGMFFGGRWKDDEIYGTTKWFDPSRIGIQSGPTSGSVYAGGMVYDKSEDAVYMSGIAYKDGPEAGNILSSCMVTKLPLGQQHFRGWSAASGKVIGNDNVLEVCNSITLHGYGELVAVGSADNGSALQNGNSYPMAGFALALDRFDLEEVDETALISRAPNDRIQYPIDIISDGDDMYIVSLTSTDTQLTPEAELLLGNGADSTYSPNWINMKKYGSSFHMVVSKLSLEEQKIDGVSMGDISFSPKWTQAFPISPDSNGNIPRVYLGGAILKKSDGYLAVAGSTRGKGEGYGTANGDDEDGFVTLLDMNTGKLATDVLKNNMREGTAQDDVVLGICDDPDDPSSFYIVGSTQGQMPGATITTPMIEGSTHAFLLKVDANTLTTSWTYQIGAEFADKDGPTTAKAFDCIVSNGRVYAAGVVDDGAGVMVHKKVCNSRGGDDIWLAAFETHDGSVLWGRQMGSDGNDHIAPRGALAINKEESVLIFGDTNGEFHRNHYRTHNVNELFFMEVTKHGQHKPHVEHQTLFEHQKIVGEPTEAPAPAPSQGIPQTTAPPFLIDMDSQAKKGPSAGLLTGILVPLGLLLIVVVFVLVRRSRSTRTPSAKVQVRDGILTDGKGNTLSRTPPASSFRDLPDGNDDSANLNIAANDII